MELENGSSLNSSEATPETTEIAGTQDGSSGVQTETPNATVESGKQPTNSTKQEVYDWTKDKRHESMWKKDPNGLYKSYRALELSHAPMHKEYTTLKTQMGEVSSILKEYGIEMNPNQLKQVLGELKTYKDPSNPVTQKASYLDEWLNNPLYKDQIVSYFQDLETREMQRQFPGMNAQQIQEHVEMKQRLDKIDADNKLAEDEKAITGYKGDIESNLSKIKTYATARGFEFTDDIKQTLLDYCDKNGIAPRYVYSTFVELYQDKVDKSFETKIKQSQIQGLNKNKNTVTLPANSKGKISGSETLSLRDRLKNAIKGT